MSTPYEQSATALTGGMQALQSSVAPGIVPMTMNQYMNPYQDWVLGNTLGRMRDDMNMGLNDVKAQAAQASAYGGARHGLVEAELMDRYNRNAGEAAGQLYHSGFNTAAQLGQSRIGQIMSGGQALLGGAGQAMSMGDNILDRQNQAGMQQQALMQRLLSLGGQQYDTFANYPQQALATALAGIQGNPLSGAGTSTERYNPGLFDYLSFGAGIMGGGK